MGRTIGDEPAGEDDDRTARKRFFLVWLIALFLSLAVLYFELDSLAKSLQDFDLSTRKSNTISRWFGLSENAAAASHDSEPHPSPHIVAAGVQIFAVGFIAWMWFQAFRIRGRAQSQKRPSSIRPAWVARLIDWSVRGGWAVGMAFILVLGFAFIMHRAYQPAVLVMALIAIIVAAEHYSGLKEAVDDLRTVGGDTKRLAENAGLSHFVHDVYQRYAVAKTIHAVVRQHEIDPVWWSFAKEEDGPWERYLNDARKAPEQEKATAERRNLARALHRKKAPG